MELILNETVASTGINWWLIIGIIIVIILLILGAVFLMNRNKATA